MRIKTLKTCSFCSKEVYRFAGHGLCASCYYREKRNGTPDYVKVRKLCTIDGCEALSIAKGMCETHYRRFKRHGVAENERFDRWGHIGKHPLAHTYYWITRNYAQAMPDAWRDFWEFAADVGERPTDKHRLQRKDASLPYSKDNVEWAGHKLDIPTSTREQRAEYARAYRAANPDVYRDQHMRKKFGKNLEWFLETQEAQGGGCAICARPETATHQKTGLPRELAVDHCHSSGLVRGLLCSDCNIGLGKFRDDPALLRAAIAYLEKHTLPADP